MATPTPARTAPVESIARNARLGDDPKVDAEFDRFERVAVRTATGGLRDPANCPAKLAKQILVGGIAWEDLERSETDCGSPGQGVRP